MTYTTPNGRLRFELEAASGKQAFEIVAAIQELFEEPDCGCCKSTAIHCQVRQIDNFKYYELACSACGARLKFGQHKDGKSIWPKRWDAENRRSLPNRGWGIWKNDGKAKAEESSEREPVQDDYDSPPY